MHYRVIIMGREKLKRANYLSLATFRKSGKEVATPVWFAEEDGQYYIFSAGDAGKVKRLRNSPRSRVAACTVSGKVTGDWVESEAVVLDDPADAQHALEALRRKYGWQMCMTDLLSRLTGKMNKRAYIRVTPLGD
jgi:PPOX class probable F420-dependent enzyme